MAATASRSSSAYRRALLFVLSADAYRTRPRFRREYVLVLVPVLLWFALAPLVLQAAAVFAPGHLLIAGALAAAGVGHLLLLRQVRMLGAAVTGVGLHRARGRERVGRHRAAVAGAAAARRSRCSSARCST